MSDHKGARLLLDALPPVSAFILKHGVPTLATRTGQCAICAGFRNSGLITPHIRSRSRRWSRQRLSKGRVERLVALPQGKCCRIVNAASNFPKSEGVKFPSFAAQAVAKGVHFRRPAARS